MTSETVTQLKNYDQLKAMVYMKVRQCKHSMIDKIELGEDMITALVGDEDWKKDEFFSVSFDGVRIFPEGKMESLLKYENEPIMNKLHGGSSTIEGRT